jgi:hypothetical protein
MSKELQTTTHTVSEPAGQTGGSANPVDGGTPMQGSSKLTIFISYMHEDTRIADAITNAIGKAFGSEIPVFLDKARIQYGDDSEQVSGQDTSWASLVHATANVTRHARRCGGQ